MSIPRSAPYPQVQQENAAFCRAFMLYSFLVPVYELRKVCSRGVLQIPTGWF